MYQVDLAAWRRSFTKKNNSKRELWDQKENKNVLRLHRKSWLFTFLLQLNGDDVHIKRLILMQNHV